MNSKTNSEKLILLGFLAHLLLKYEKGVGTKSLELCMYILKNSNQSYGKDYQSLHHKSSGYSMATVHKVFSLFIKKGIIRKDNEGNLRFNADYALELAKKEDIFL